MGSAVGVHDAGVAGSARVIYDAAGRDVSKYTFSPNSPTTVRTATKVWDASGATGLLSSVTDPLGQTTSYVYDPAKRIFGSGATHVAGIAAFDDAYAKHKVSRDAIRIAGEPRPMAPPVFLKPLEEYRSKIEDAYTRVPSMRKQDVALVLLCFSDSKIITCRDKQGHILR